MIYTIVFLLLIAAILASNIGENFRRWMDAQDWEE